MIRPCHLKNNQTNWHACDDKNHCTAMLNILLIVPLNIYRDSTRNSLHLTPVFSFQQTLQLSMMNLQHWLGHLSFGYDIYVCGKFIHKWWIHYIFVKLDVMIYLEMDLELGVGTFSMNTYFLPHNRSLCVPQDWVFKKNFYAFCFFQGTVWNLGMV